MRDFAGKLGRLEQALSKENGPFALFALFLREEAPNVWDLVVAADWIDEDESQALVDISKRVRAYLGPKEIMKLSRVVTVKTSNPGLKEIASAVSTDHGMAEVANSDFFGLDIRRGFIIAVQWNPPAKKVLPRRAASGGRR